MEKGEEGKHRDKEGKKMENRVGKRGEMRENISKKVKQGWKKRENEGKHK